MKLGLMMAVVLAMLVSDPAQAAREDRRQHRQKARIHQGVSSRELTEGEAARLRSEQRRIRRSERRAEADGDVSAREKRRLERRQDKASRDIHRLKQNERDRDANVPAPAENAAPPAEKAAQ